MLIRPLSRHLWLSLLFTTGCTNGQEPSTSVRAGGPAPASPSDLTGSRASASTPSSASDTYNLRGAPVQGATRRTEITFNIQKAQFTMNAGGIELSGTMSSKMQNTEDLEVQEVSDGLIRKGRLSHVLDKSTNTLSIKLPDGTEKAEESEENGALHGRVEAIEFSGGQWKRTLAGPAATPEQDRLLASPAISDMTFPTAIKVGESWTESGPELRRWLGSDVLTVRGEMKNTLLAVELQQGEKVAVIESIGEIEATMLDADNQETQMTLGLQGTTRRSLDRGLDLEGTAAGAIKLSGNLVEDGVKMALAVTGHYSAEFRGSLR